MKIDLENFPTSESAVRMLESVSTEFYEKSYVGKWLYQVMGVEYDAALKIAEELPLQLFPETATWGLRYHEEKWQLPVRENLRYDERRKLIYEKMQFKAPMTPYRMEQYLNQVIGMEFHVLDCHDSGGFVFQPSHPNIFKVVCISEDSLDAKKVRKILDRIKQSHTTYTITDLVIIILDNQAAEHICVQKLYIHLSIPFQVAWFLNGEYWLDGRKILDSAVRFGMFTRTDDTRIIYKGISVQHPERFGNVDVILKKNEWYLNGEYLLDGGKLLNAEITKEMLEED